MKSKVSSPATRYTTSAATSSLSQWATSANGSLRSNASVAFTVPSSTGTSTGSRSTGNSNSRARAWAVIAANKVPMAAKPSVPRPITSASPDSTGARSRLKKSANSSSTMASITNISARLPPSLPR